MCYTLLCQVLCDFVFSNYKNWPYKNYCKNATIYVKNMLPEMWNSQKMKEFNKQKQIFTNVLQNRCSQKFRRFHRKTPVLDFSTEQLQWIINIQQINIRQLCLGTLVLSTALFRSSRSLVFFKTPVLESLFNKVAGIGLQLY